MLSFHLTGSPYILFSPSCLDLQVFPLCSPILPTSPTAPPTNTDIISSTPQVRLFLHSHCHHPAYTSYAVLLLSNTLNTKLKPYILTEVTAQIRIYLDIEFISTEETFTTNRLNKWQANPGKSFKHTYKFSSQNQWLNQVNWMLILCK